MPSDEPEPVFDGGSPRTRKRILYQLNERLKMEPGVKYTRFDPSRITPETVIASITQTEFLGEAYPARFATLEVWWSPQVASKDYFTIQWYEAPDREQPTDGETATDPTHPEGYTLTCGWHQDDHFTELGTAHFQEEYPDGSTELYGVEFEDATPRWIVSECLRDLPIRLSEFRKALES